VDIQNQQGEQPVTLGEWMITMLITAIPLVGIIMLFVWAFGSGTNTSKANWAKASLLWIVIGVVIGLVFLGSIITAMMAAFQQ
jgi:hypothetical protein